MRNHLATVLLLCFSGASCTGDGLPNHASVGQASGALSGLSPESDHTGQNPTVTRGGRFTAVAIDPTDSDHAVAVAESGGVYVSFNRGASWETAVNSDGTYGTYGHGFEGTGVNSFREIAISPDGHTMLLLAGPGNANGSQGGLWRSTDGAATWTKLVSQPIEDSGERSRIRFSTTKAHVVYAIAGNQLGISSDDGASFSWSDPIALQPGGGALHAILNGLDVFPAGSKPNPFGETAATGGSDALVFCATITAASSKRVVIFYNVRTGEYILQNAPPLGDSTLGGFCMAAFDPNNSNHIFVASQQNGLSNISQGIYDPTTHKTKWADLMGPTAKNGRAAFVQTRRKDGETVTVYYHDSVHLSKVDCPSGSAQCAPGAWPPPLQVKHTDTTRIAFDPLGGDSCIVSDDGGLERSDDCATNWDAKITGVHAMQPTGASFAGQGAAKAVFLDLHDNGTYVSALNDADLANPPNGKGLSWLPWYEHFGPEGYDGAWSTQYRTDTDMGLAGWNGFKAMRYTNLRSGTPTITEVPLPPGTPIPGGERSPVGVFVAPGLVDVPAVDGNDNLQMYQLDVATLTYTQLGVGTPITVKTSPYVGITVAGETAANPDPSVYLFIGGGPLWYFHGGGWHPAAGPKNAVQAWGDSLNNNRTYVRDSSNNSVWKTGKPGTGPTDFAVDSNLTDAVTNNTQFMGSQLTAVAFDPLNPDRIAVGTSDNGVLLSIDGGVQNWSPCKIPEPHGRVVGLYFDEKAGPNGENALVAIWGQGLWAVRLGASKIKWPGPSWDGWLTGMLTGIDDHTIPEAQLRVRVVDTDKLSQHYADYAAAHAAVPEEELDDPDEVANQHPGSAPTFDPVEVDAKLCPPPTTPVTYPTPPPDVAYEVVADFIAPSVTDAYGEFSIKLPPLPAGNYLVQVIYAGDGINPPVISGSDLTLTEPLP